MLHTKIRSQKSKFNNRLINNAEYLDIVIPMYNLLEYCDNYSLKSESLWNYYKNEMNDDGAEVNDANFKINNGKVTKSRSFEYKTQITRNTPANDNILDTENVVPLKYLSNFWRYLSFSFINCEIMLDLRW